MSTDKVETTLEYSILKVPVDGGMEHAILITTSIRTASFVLQSKDQQAVTLDLLATYIDGPIPPDNFEAGFICRMGGHIDTHNNKVKLTNSAVVVVPCMQGFGIGTFLFNQVVCWAKQHDSQLEVVPIRVAATDANEGNQHRRNMFYAHFNILFSDSPTNEGVVEAYSIPMRVSNLTPHVSKKNKLQEQSIESTLRLMVAKQRKLVDQNRDLTVSLQGKDRVIAQRDRSESRTGKVLLGIIGVLCLALGWRW